MRLKDLWSRSRIDRHGKTVLVTGILLILANVQVLEGQQIKGQLEMGEYISRMGPAGLVWDMFGEKEIWLLERDDGVGVFLAGWNDEMKKTGGRGALVHSVGTWRVGVGLEYATVRDLEEISEYEPTGREIPVQDIRLDIVGGKEEESFWWLLKLQGLDQELAALRETTVNLGVAAGGRSRSKELEIIVEGNPIVFAGTNAFAPRYGRIGGKLGAWIDNISPLLAVEFREVDKEANWSPSVSAGMEWQPQWSQVPVALLLGSNWDAEGIRGGGAELRMIVAGWNLGIQVQWVAPGWKGYGAWLVLP